jgi:hypothetical protein
MTGKYPTPKNTQASFDRWHPSEPMDEWKLLMVDSVGKALAAGLQRMFLGKSFAIMRNWRDNNMI